MKLRDASMEITHLKQQTEKNLLFFSRYRFMERPVYLVLFLSNHQGCGINLLLLLLRTFTNEGSLETSISLEEERGSRRRET